MDSAYSMWRSRTIPDPKQPDRPACETVSALHCYTWRGTAAGPLHSLIAFHKEQFELEVLSRRRAPPTRGTV